MIILAIPNNAAIIPASKATYKSGTHIINPVPADNTPKIRQARNT